MDIYSKKFKDEIYRERKVSKFTKYGIRINQENSCKVSQDSEIHYAKRNVVNFKKAQ
jgi:hypothetical protein